MNKALFTLRSRPIMLGHPCFSFALSKRALKAIYAAKYIDMISLPNFLTSGQLAQSIKKKQRLYAPLANQQGQTSQVSLEQKLEKSSHSQDNTNQKMKNQFRPNPLRDVLLSWRIEQALDKIGQRKEDQDQKIMQQARQQMHAYFLNGIKLPDRVFQQSRFSNATNISSQKTLQQSEIKPGAKFTFFPSYMVTGQIFSKIEFAQRLLMIYGQKGASKSCAFALRVLLENQITAFRVLEANNLQELQKFEKFMSPPRVKYLYWSIDQILEYKIDDIESFCQSVIQCLTSQCPQIEKSLVEKLNKIKQKADNQALMNEEEVSKKLQILVGIIRSLIKILQEQYSKYNIEITVVVDQINSLFTHVRQANKLSQLNEKQFKLKKSGWELQFNIVNLINRIRKIVTRSNKFRVIYNSSLNIEDRSQKQKDIKYLGSYIKVKMDNRSELPRHQLIFEQSEFSQIRISQIKHFLMFELQRQIPNIRTRLNVINQITGTFAERRMLKFMTPFMIRTIISKKSAVISDSIDSSYKLDKNVLAEQFQSEYQRLVIDPYINFLQKGDQSRKSFNLALLHIALIQNVDKPVVEGSTIRVKVAKIVDSDQVKNLQQFIDKSLFKIENGEPKFNQNRSHKYISTILTCQDMVDILAHISGNIAFNERFAKNLIQQLKFFTGLAGSNLGNIVQLWMILALRKKHVLTLAQANPKTSNDVSLEIGNISSLISFKNYQSKSLREIFPNLISLKETTILYIPITETGRKASQKQDNQFSLAITMQNKSSNSYGTDFVIIQKKQKDINFYFFQLTVQDTTNHSNKMKGLLRYISKISDFQQEFICLDVQDKELNTAKTQQYNFHIHAIVVQNSVERSHLTQPAIYLPIIKKVVSYNDKKKNQTDTDYQNQNKKFLTKIINLIEEGKLTARYLKYSDCVIKPTHSLFSKLYQQIVQQLRQRKGK